MSLALGSPYDTSEYPLEFDTVPAAGRAGEPIRMFFRIFRPDTGEQIRNFEVVHEKQYHLFVVSQDLEFFDHIHPEQGPDGTWSIEVTLPKPGNYQVMSDFLPSGGSPQFIARPLVTAGYAADIFAGSARLVPETAPTIVVDDITAKVAYSPKMIWAEMYAHFEFTLTETASGRPVTNLQSYLGSLGHSFIISEDLTDYIHSHPVEPPPTGDTTAFRGGPTVTFEGLVPKPGRYRAWAQFLRNDKLYTFRFTFGAGDLEAPVTR